MTNSVELVSIGGIKFNKNEIRNVNVKKDLCYSGDLYSVETTKGTFTYRDFPNSIISDGKKIERTIIGSTITNCSLENIKGTDKTDKYHVNNSVINNIFDLSGDEGNRDRVYLNKSYVSEYKCDKDDKYNNFNIDEKISF